MSEYEVTNQHVKCNGSKFDTGHTHFLTFQAIFQAVVFCKLLTLSLQRQPKAETLVLSNARRFYLSKESSSSERVNYITNISI